jgi:hypothetical protein
MSFKTSLKHKEKLFPLKLFYELKGRPLPHIEEIPGEDIPYPGHHLLVHDSDMTSKLQEFYGRSIHINVFHKELRGDSLDREVVLNLDGNKKPVEYGAIQIDLTNIPDLVKEQILECKLPLGGILNQNKIRYTSSPRQFFRVRSDQFMIDIFALRHPYPLYGRCNILSHEDGNILADVVEILPPVDSLYD